MTEENDIYVYVDESGSTILSDCENDNRFYVAAAIVVEGGMIDNLNSLVDNVSRSFNNGQPLKSSKIAGNVDRRLKLLRALRNVPFKYIALAVDKQRVDRESGLRFNQIFYKNINRRLYAKITKNSNGKVHAIVDTYGSEDYQKSAFKYFEGEYPLFSPLECRAVSDEHQRIVQLADIVSGSLRNWLARGITDDKQYAEVREILQSKEILLQCWPPLYSSPETIQLGAGADERDEKIERVMVSKACELINAFESSDQEDDERKAEVLKYLIESRIGNKDVYCEKLLSVVNRRCERPIGRKSFLSNIIGGIRREGVIITGTHKGYRLATTWADVEAYLQQDRTVILPMLRKLQCARQMLLTSANLDIVSGEANQELKVCQEALSNLHIEAFVTNQEIDDEKILPAE